MLDPEVEHGLGVMLEHALTKRQIQCLKELQETGLFGETCAEVAVVLLGERIRELAIHGWCSQKSRTRPPPTGIPA
jgi:hypothetical protein